MSEVKVNKISPRTACGTVTLGDSGDTFTIPSGATITNSGTASGFGATGAVSWDTSSIKTAGFTATVGIGYFCNTTSGIFTVALPAGSAGDVVGIADYAQTFNTNNLTVAPDGSEKIGGIVGDAVMTVDGVAATLVYVDGTQGWTVTDSGSSTDVPGPQFITATGGTPCSGAVDGDYKVHTFTGPGTLCVSNAGNVAGSTTVDFLVIAGGGGGGKGEGNTDEKGGGGGSGGYLASYPNPATGGHPVAVTPYAITVGGGGTGGGPAQPNVATQGSSSIFSTITSAGGGRAGQNHPAYFAGGDGGTGGGGSGGGPRAGGSGNTPPVSSPSNPVQGFNGGNGIAAPSGAGGGGGGASAIGANGASGCGGNGGAGFTSCITGSPVPRGGGGGGGAGGAGGTATAGGGVGAGCSPCTAAAAGTVNTGGGGGGGGRDTGATNGADGGSGIVVIRYKFQ